jgi:hypothetical protein
MRPASFHGRVPLRGVVSRPSYRFGFRAARSRFRYRFVVSGGADCRLRCDHSSGCCLSLNDEFR